MRRSRGNIILTALFVSIFLFFLSVALLYANRQDIALSLSMEHKLRAQAGAQSFAMEVYGHLREFGELRRQPTKEENGMSYRVELLSVPPNGERGKVLRVRSRATSGPVSSYYTLHLLETDMVSEGSGNPLIFFPSESGTSGVLRTDFVLRDLPVDLMGDVVARDGPIMRAKPGGSSQPQFLGYVPIFPEAGSTVQAFGPVLTVGPPLASLEETALQWLDYQGEKVEWVDIPPPENLESEGFNFEGQPTVVPLEELASTTTNISLNGVNDNFRVRTWKDEQPSTGSVDEIQSLTSGDPLNAAPLVDWSTIPGQDVQEWFVTRGKVAVRGKTLYTHGWHYVFRPYSGGLPDPVTPLDAPQITRWPCVLSYSLDSKQWRKVWTPLDSSGDVESSLRPNPKVLLVKSDGSLFSVTEGAAPLLMLLQDTGNATVTNPVEDPESLFIYRDQIHTINQSGLIENLESGTTISFASLPDRIPEIMGELLEIPEVDTLSYDEVGVVDITPAGALEITGTQLTTIRPEILLSYRVSDGAKPAFIGKDLITVIDVYVLKRTTGRASFDDELLPKDGKTLARFDGAQWHILPCGLRALLEYKRHHSRIGSDEEEETVGSDLAAPDGSENVLVGDYPDGTQAMSRYTIISVDTNPFEFGE